MQHISPQFCEQGLRLRGICDGQRTEGIVSLLRERVFQRRRAEILSLLGRDVIGKRARCTRRQYQQHSQKHKQPLFHRHSPIMVKNVRISGSAAYSAAATPTSCTAQAPAACPVSLQRLSPIIVRILMVMHLSSGPV